MTKAKQNCNIIIYYVLNVPTENEYKLRMLSANEQFFDRE